jgi:hypothetical protein
MLELLELGVAHQIGACTRDGRPVICRGVAARLESDGRLVVIVSGESGREVLDAIRDTGRVSVNFTLPENYRSLNLVGRDAAVSFGGACFRTLVEARHRTFAAQLARLGFRPEYTSAWHNPPDDDLMAIRFTPLSARNQTPGPGAGNAVELLP